MRQSTAISLHCRGAVGIVSIAKLHWCFAVGAVIALTTQTPTPVGRNVLPLMWVHSPRVAPIWRAPSESVMAGTTKSGPGYTTAGGGPSVVVGQARFASHASPTLLPFRSS